MFRRLPNTLPADPVFPHDLEKLGYYINDDDQIRSIAHPDQDFNFFISKNVRVRDVQREAMDACIRNHLTARLVSLPTPLTPTRLPPNAPPSTPHIPILTTPDLPHASRLLLYFGESTQDLGILAYRVIGQENIAAGSILSFVSAVQNLPRGAETGIVVANLGQLIWCRREKRAVTLATWNALPRKSGVDGPMAVRAGNKVAGHENAQAHVREIFAYVNEVCRKDVMVDVVGVGEGAESVVEYLDQNWGTWEGRVRGVCVGLGFVLRAGEVIGDAGFGEFWGKKARAYLIHNEPVGTPLYGREEIGCNCYSSGETTHTECIMPRAGKHILAFFRLLDDVPGYCEVPIQVPKDEADSSRVVKWVGGEEADGDM